MEIIQKMGESTEECLLTQRINENNNCEYDKVAESESDREVEAVPYDTEKKKFYRWKIVWFNIGLILGVHALGLYGLFTKYYYIPKWQTFFYNVLSIAVGGMGVTAGRHRLWCHKSYKVWSLVEVAFMFMAASVYEQSIYVWCRDHRLHHKYSDTDADPYNSRRGFFFCHIGWFFLRKHKEVTEKGKGIDVSDLEANPIVMFEHKHNKLLAFLFTFLVPSFIPWFLWDEMPEVSIFYCCFWRLLVILHITWSVNSFAHLYGWRPYDKKIQPVENDLVALFTAGEGFHNYHHTFPWDYKTGELGGDACNLTTVFIDALALFGLAYSRKRASREMIDKRVERTGDKFLLRQKNFHYIVILGIAVLLFF